MKYQKEVNDMIRCMIYESWMDEDDYKEVEKNLYDCIPDLKETLSKDLEDGVNNGHSLEYQIDLGRKVLKKLKE